jgi:hypothetical protein
MTSNTDDGIVDEIRRRPQAHADSLGYDLERITEVLQRHGQESGVQVVERAPRKAQVLPNRSAA